MAVLGTLFDSVAVKLVKYGEQRGPPSPFVFFLDFTSLPRGCELQIK